MSEQPTAPVLIEADVTRAAQLVVDLTVPGVVTAANVDHVSGALGMWAMLVHLDKQSTGRHATLNELRAAAQAVLDGTAPVVTT